jgi:hypothetical protein
VKPKGALREPDAGGGVVTNMTSWHKAVYEHAVLEWGEVVDLRRGEYAPLAIKWVRLNYQEVKSRKESVRLQGPASRTLATPLSVRGGEEAKRGRQVATAEQISGERIFGAPRVGGRSV